MFRSLKENRSLIMGLAIFWVAFFHIPWIDREPWIDCIHDVGYIGVDIFLFLSGFGACHSIEKRGREGYLIQRAKRIFPSLMPILLVWSIVMFCIDVLNFEELFGSITLLGWWLGQSKQLNWYFSAVWMFFLLGAVLYKPVIRGKHPVFWVIFVAWLSWVAMLLSPYHYHAEAFCRVPIFLIGMVLGRAEILGNRSEGRLRGVLYSLLPVGLVLTVIVWRSWGAVYGDAYGLWWYPFILVVPGGVFLASELAHRLRRICLFSLGFRCVEWLGEASAEILAIQVGVYKLIQIYTGLLPKQWVLVMLGCLVLGVGYHKLVEKVYKR